MEHKPSRLESLSDDLLEHISRHLLWLDIVCLWFCGSTQLCRRLAHGGVAQLALEISAHSNWPSFVPLLTKLSTFQFTAQHSWLESGSVPLQLASLPKNLRNLSIDVPGALVALSNLLAVSPSAFPMLETLDIAGYAGDSRFALVELRWPQFLLSLTFTVFNGPGIPLDTSALPPHLTYLNARFSEMQEHASHPFPTTLETLILRLDCFADIVPLLPAGLTSFMLSEGNDDCIADPEQNPELAHWTDGFPTPLPPSLTVLKVPIYHYSKTILAQIPQTVTHICHWERPVDLEDVKLLPPQLRFATHLLPELIDISLAKMLPRTLEEVESEVTLGAMLHLPNLRKPRSVANWESGVATEMEIMHLKTVSEACQTMRIETLRDFPVTKFPKNLKVLITNEFTLSSSDIQLLPTTLKILYVCFGCLSQSLEDWKLLPNLETLVLNCCPQLSPESSWNLPRTLRTLRISNVAGKTPLDWFAGLPEQLTSLDLRLELASASFSEINLPQCLNSLSLSIQHPKGDMIRNLMKVSFPRTLTSFLLLCLRSNGSFQTPFNRLTAHDVKTFAKRHWRIRELQLLQCCDENVTTKAISEHLGPLCLLLQLT